MFNHYDGRDIKPLYTTTPASSGVLTLADIEKALEPIKYQQNKFDKQVWYWQRYLLDKWLGKDKPMSVSASEVNRMDMTEDDRFLLEQGILDSSGALTSAGRDVLLEILKKQNKAELVKVARTVVGSRKETKGDDERDDY